MDISSPSLVPRLVADLRPSADAAATARIAEPPPALAQGPAAAPVSAAQGALVARGLLGPRPVSPSGGSGGAELGPDHAPPRVLKPWGVPMLPAEEDTGARGAPRGTEKATGGRGVGESGPNGPERAGSGPAVASGAGDRTEAVESGIPRQAAGPAGAQPEQEAPA